MNSRHGSRARVTAGPGPRTGLVLAGRANECSWASPDSSRCLMGNSFPLPAHLQRAKALNILPRLAAAGPPSPALDGREGADAFCLRVFQEDTTTELPSTAAGPGQDTHQRESLEAEDATPGAEGAHMRILCALGAGDRHGPALDTRHSTSRRK